MTPALAGRNLGPGPAAGEEAPLRSPDAFVFKIEKKVVFRAWPALNAPIVEFAECGEYIEVCVYVLFLGRGRGGRACEGGGPKHSLEHMNASTARPLAGRARGLAAESLEQLPAITIDLTRPRIHNKTRIYIYRSMHAIAGVRRERGLAAVSRFFLRRRLFKFFETGVAPAEASDARPARHAGDGGHI